MSASDTNLLRDSSVEAIPGLIPGSSLIAVDVEEGARAVPCCLQDASEHATDTRFSWNEVAPPGIELTFFPLLDMHILDFVQGKPVLTLLVLAIKKSNSELKEAWRKKIKGQKGVGFFQLRSGTTVGQFKPDWCSLPVEAVWRQKDREQKDKPNCNKCSSPHPQHPGVNRSNQTCF